MYKIPKATKTVRWIIIISLVYGLLLSVLFLMNILSFPNASYIFLGVATGIVSWVCTHGLASWLDQEDREQLYKVHSLLEKHVEEKFPPHTKDTTEILNTVQEKYLSLVSISRDMMDSKFYAIFFENVCHVKVSGIANTKLINDLCIFKEKHNIIKSLLSGNSDTVIEILCVHPKSEFARIRDNVESKINGREKPCSSDIIENLNKLNKLKEIFETTKLPGNNRMQIRLSCLPISPIVTYCKKINPEAKEKLLIGFIFHHAIGNRTSFYQVPKSANPIEGTVLFQECIANFDSLFTEARNYKVLLWDRNGIDLDLPILNKSCNI